MMTKGTETIVTASKAVVVFDHLKNNRLEYLLLMAIGTVLGWTQEAVSYASGVCA
ncbi:MAG: hypothetical protein ACO3NJ_09090 [Candidatus Poseidoniaceae archaeon]